MSDMMQYYQQISELKKAVRERELQRLDIEKQALVNAQRREKRHENFKDKIREIQKELVQKEMEATKNFQTLLARVESIRREHQLLAAHTEQLRQRKIRYEMSLNSINPKLHHSTTHQDLSVGEPTWKEMFQATSSTPAPTSHIQRSPTSSLLHQPTLTSPIQSSLTSHSHRRSRPADLYLPESLINKQPQPSPVPMTNTSVSNSLMQGYIPPSVSQRQGSLVNTSPQQHFNMHYSNHPMTNPLPPSNGLMQELNHTGLASSNLPKPTLAYTQPSNLSYTSLGEIYKAAATPTTATGNIQHLNRNEVELMERSQSLSHDAPLIQQTDLPFSDTSIPVHPVSIPSLDIAGVNHVTPLSLPFHQSSVQMPPQSMIPTHLRPQYQQPLSLPMQPQSTLQLQPSSIQPETIPLHQESPRQLQSVHQPQQSPIQQSLNHSHSSIQSQQSSIQAIQPVYQPQSSHQTHSVYQPQVQSTLLSPQSPYQSQSLPPSTLQLQLQTQVTSSPSLNKENQSTTMPLCTTEYSQIPRDTVYNESTSPLTSAKRPIDQGGLENELSFTSNFTNQDLPTSQLPMTVFSNDSSTPVRNTLHTNHSPLESGINKIQSDFQINRELPEKDINLQFKRGIEKDPHLEINREIPERDGGLFQSSIVRQSPQQIQNMQSQEDMGRNMPLLDINDGPKESYTPGRYDGGALNEEDTAKNRTINNSTTNLNTSTQQLPINGDENVVNNGINISDFDTLKHDLNTDKRTEEIENAKLHPSPRLQNNNITSKAAIDLEETKQYNNDHLEGDNTTLSNLNSSNRELNNGKSHNTMENTHKLQHPKVSNNNVNSLYNDNRTSVIEPRQSTLTSEKHITETHHQSPKSTSSSPKQSTSPPSINNDTSIRPTLVPQSPNVARLNEDSDVDFFDQNINLTESATYKSLVNIGRKSSLGIESESDEAEANLTTNTSKPQTPVSRRGFKPFASTIPSLRPAHHDTDTDSVDSVEAAIQAAMKKKDLEAAPSPRQHPQSQASLKEEDESPTTLKATIKPGTDAPPGKTKPAMPLNLDSDVESYEVSGGGEQSDEDDFDFYDKF